MRLMIITKGYPPRNNARSLQIGKVAEAIRIAGVDVSVVAGLEKKARRDEGRWANEHVLYVPYWCLRDQIGFVGRVVRFLEDGIGSVNPRGSWVRRSVAAALKQMEAFRPDCLLTSSVPFETHLIGLAVKRLTGIPWVASFSDPWPLWLCPPPYYRRPLPLLGRVSMAALARVVETCDAVHMPSRHGIDWTAGASELPLKHKAVAIPHIGFSTQFTNRSREHVGWLAHVGHLSRERASEAVLRGLHEARQRIPECFRGLLCVGWVCREFRAMVQRMGLGQTIRFTGRIPAAEAVAVIRSATALLVIEADMEVSPYLPSKFADYALAGKPILAITPAVSAVRDFLSRDGGGIAVRHDGEEIADAIANLFSQDAVNGFWAYGANSRLAEAFSPITIGNQYRELFSCMRDKRLSIKD